MDNNDLLADCWERWAERIDTLSAEEATAPTRCAGWNVHELVAHVCPDVGLLQALPSLVIDTAATIADATVLLRAFNAPDGAAHTMAEANAATARSNAATVTLDALAEGFRNGATVVRSSPLADIATIPHPLGQTVTVSVVRDIALMEATVHLLDLAAAIGGVAPPVNALIAVRDLLVRLTDPTEFIEVATGRRSCTSVFPSIR